MGFSGCRHDNSSGSIVRGLTTAASLWTASGIGLVVGVGFYFAAFVATFLVFFILAVLKRVEIGLVGVKGHRILAVATHDKPGQLGKIGSTLGGMNVDIRNIAQEQNT